MKIWSRDFTTREKILLVVLIVVLLGLGYYRFVDMPVREAIASAEAEQEILQAELDVVQVRVNELTAIRSELDEITVSEQVSFMPSYNNSEAELALLNDVLRDTLQYSISFANVTRSGDQIRRNFTLQFKTVDYDAMEEIIDALSGGPYRCLIGDIRCSMDDGGAVSANVTATFFETMAGGTPDAGLPEDSAVRG